MLSQHIFIGYGMKDNKIKESNSYNTQYRIEQDHEYLVLNEFSYTLNQLVILVRTKNSKMLCEMIKDTPKIIVSDSCLEQNTVDLINKLGIGMTLQYMKINTQSEQIKNLA